jgi:hypothetical protein
MGAALYFDTFLSFRSLFLLILLPWLALILSIFSVQFDPPRPSDHVRDPFPSYPLSPVLLPPPPLYNPAAIHISFLILYTSF